MAPKTASRFNFIDTIRGIAAYSVMMQHSLYQSGILGDRPNSTLTGFIPTWLELGETGVVAFFLVSGFVIPLSIEKTKNIKLFWVHRALRIYPLYLSILLIGVIFLIRENNFSIQKWFFVISSNLMFIQEYLKQATLVGGSWTLSLELVWYIGVATIFALGRLKNTGAIACLAIAGSLVAQASCAFGWHLPMGRLSMLVCCVIGLVCYRRTQNELSNDRFNVLLASLFATVALNMWVTAHPPCVIGSGGWYDRLTGQGVLECVEGGHSI